MDDNFFSRFGNKQEAADVPTEAPAPTSMDAFETRFGKNVEVHQEATRGGSPDNPIDESPMGIIDRARLGWERTPKAQEKLLSDMYGAGNVKMNNNGFVVKHEGKWREVDPEFQWHFSGKGAIAGAAAGLAVANAPGAIIGGAIGGFGVPSLSDEKNLKDIGKDVANFAGEYGLRTAGAVKGGAEGAALGAAGGPIGSFVGGVVGAGLGAAGADAVEMGARATSGLSNPDSLPKNADETAKQLAASFIFGATQELGGKALNLGYKGSVYALEGALKRVGVTPESKMLLAKTMSVVSGNKPTEELIRINNPSAMVPHDLHAAQDALTGKDTLWDSMRGKVEDAFNSMRSRKAKLSEGYQAVTETASKVKYEPKDATLNIVKELHENGYIEKPVIGQNPVSKKPIFKLEIVSGEGSAIARDIKPSEKGAISYVLNQARNIGNRLADKEHVSYDEMHHLINTINNKLYESDAIVDPNLRRILTGYSASLKEHLIERLDTFDKGAAQKLLALDRKWGPIKDFMNELATKKEGARLDTFLKQLIKDDGTHNSQLMNSMSEFLGTANPTEELLRMNLARKTARAGIWGRKIWAVPVPTGPRTSAAIIQGGAAAKQAVGQFTDAIPFMNQATQFVKGMDRKTRAQFYANPQAMEAVQQLISGATVGEKMTKEQLLKEVGVK